MSHLLLSHLSKNNNHPDLVHSLFEQHADDTQIILASRDRETAVFSVTDTKQENSPLITYEAIRKNSGVQMSLFS